jgi:diaminohydroxyphosphoribosylaminopyrimidine deaminase/5-amino-6-(5-phosphoribosylamino)uracil reductase
MRAALRAARRGDGCVSPNPIVGAAVAIPGKNLVTAHHARFGDPHAEARLLDRAAPHAPLPAGSTVFVTLEPCDHHGKTPPCADRVIAARPACVVVACLDSDPRVAGRGVARLRAAGIEVLVGVGEDEALAANLPFHLRHRLGRALCRLKLASSLDARLGSPAGRERRVTGEQASRAVHRERAASDAILVGSGTMVADDPLLTVRAVRGPDPSRIVLDSGLRTPLRCRTWRAWTEELAPGAGRAMPAEAAPSSGPAMPVEVAGNYRRVTGRSGPRWERRARLVLATCLGHPARRLDAYRRLGWEVWELPLGRTGSPGEGRISLSALAIRAGREGFLRVLVEAGPRLAGAFLAAGLVDELSLYLAPIVLGGPLGWPADWEARGMRRAVRFEPVTEAALGADRHLLLRRAGLLESVRRKGLPGVPKGDTAPAGGTAGR